MLVDTSFDFRTDSNGQDPDFASPKLRRCHKILWSKTLPSGAPFNLDAANGGPYLHHPRSKVGEFFLSSDGIIATFSRRPSMSHIVDQIPSATIDEFNTIASTIAGFLVWPGRQIDGMWTINQARGCLRNISDRIDLTLECVRRHYEGEDSSLALTLTRYGDFFALFTDFHGYVDFFLLQDLVTDDYSTVRFFMPFDKFETSALPKDVDTYQEYRRLSTEFVHRRNRRIDTRSTA
jgi:hypothetical protein